MANLIKEWNLDDGTPGVYLDNASTTYPKPHSVYDFMARFYRRRGCARQLRDFEPTGSALRS